MVARCWRPQQNRILAYILQSNLSDSQGSQHAFLLDQEEWANPIGMTDPEKTWSHATKSFQLNWIGSGNKASTNAARTITMLHGPLYRHPELSRSLHHSVSFVASEYSSTIVPDRVHCFNPDESWPGHEWFNAGSKEAERSQMAHNMMLCQGSPSYNYLLLFE